MSNGTLANEYRPDRFDDVLGQSIWVKKLAKRLAENRVPRVILIGGPSGTGKTTTARLVAKSAVCTVRLNGEADPCNSCTECKSVDQGGGGMNYMFLDGGSGDLAEVVRGDLKLTMESAPAGGSRYKCCIIDEFQAFGHVAKSALLTIFEELPKTSVIVCTTTDLTSIHEALRDRAYEIEYAPIPADQQVTGVLKFRPDLEPHVSSIRLLAKYSKGTQRRLWSMIDRVDGDWSKETISKVTSQIDDDSLDNLLEMAFNRDYKKMTKLWDNLEDEGTPMLGVCDQLLDRLCTKAAEVPDDFKYTEAIKVFAQAHLHGRPEVFKRALFQVGTEYNPSPDYNLPTLEQLHEVLLNGINVTEDEQLKF